MTIDANIVIGYLNGDPDIIDTLTGWKKDSITLFLSTIAEAEVLSYSKLTPQERQATAKFLEENFVSIPCDRGIAREASRLRSASSIRLPDAIIAASALSLNIPLVTRNIRDFRNIQSLQVVSI